MSSTVPPAPADRLAGIIDGMCGAVAARGGGAGRLPGPLLILIWTRLRRLAARFAALAARLRAGTLGKPRAPRRRRRAAPPPPPPPPPPTQPQPQPHPQQSLPRNFRWLIRLIPQTAAGASQLRHLLADPEMAALIAAAPQAGRILRPLCRMLGIRPPPGLALPRKPAPAAAAAAAAPPPTPPPRRRRRAKLRAALGSPGACLPPVSA